MAKPLAECPFDCLGTPDAQTGYMLETPVVRGLLKLFERVDVQLIVDSGGEAGPDPGNGLEKLLRLQGARDPVEQAPASRSDELGDGSADASANAGQFHQALDATDPNNLINWPGQLHHGLCRPAIGRDPIAILMLQFEDVGHLPQLVGNHLVTRMDHSSSSIGQRHPRITKDSAARSPCLQTKNYARQPLEPLISINARASTGHQSLRIHCGGHEPRRSASVAR